MANNRNYKLEVQALEVELAKVKRDLQICRAHIENKNVELLNKERQINKLNELVDNAHSFLKSTNERMEREYKLFQGAVQIIKS